MTYPDAVLAGEDAVPADGGKTSVAARQARLAVLWAGGGVMLSR